MTKREHGAQVGASIRRFLARYVRAVAYNILVVEGMRVVRSAWKKLGE